MCHLALTLTKFFATTFLIAFALMTMSGCGSIKGRTATEQLLVSDAVDRSIEQIDFSALRGKDVYLDCKYLKAVRSVGFVNAEYIISSLREKMTVAGCRLRENPVEATFIAEVRVGCLGSDCHEVNYGIPGSQALNQTASLLASAPLPSVPEISIAKTDSCSAAAKISLFAYQRETREPIWESGPSQGTSLAKSTWVLGAGPFQEGHIYEDVEALQNRPINLPEAGVRHASFGGPVMAMLKSARQRVSRNQVDGEMPEASVASKVIGTGESGIAEILSQEAPAPVADVDEADVQDEAPNLASVDSVNAVSPAVTEAAAADSKTVPKKAARDEITAPPSTVTDSQVVQASANQPIESGKVESAE